MDDNYKFEFSETASINLYIIRILSAQLIGFAHGIQGLGFFRTGEFIGTPGLIFLFLMSGLLISHNVFKKMKRETYDFKEFIINRFSRVYPSLLLVLIIIIFLDAVWLNFFGGKDISNSYNIVSFIITLLFLNDSALGIYTFGTAHQLWALPPIWFLYMVFGWLLLGTRTTKKKYLYFIILALFGFLLVVVIFGLRIWHKIICVVIWCFGVAFILLMNKLDAAIVKSSNKDTIKKRIRYISVVLAILFFILAMIRLITHQDPFGIVYFLFFTGTILCIFVFSQYTELKYPEKVKKSIIFMANYSFTFYLLHFSFLNLILPIFMNYLNDIVALIFSYVLVNIASLGVAYITEFKYYKIRGYLSKKLISNKKTNSSLS